MTEPGGGLAALVVPAALLVVPWYAFYRGVPVYEKFTEGAARAFGTAVRIIPYLVGTLVAVGVFRASGALELLTAGLAPWLNRIGFPADLLPLALVRPLSGSGALAVLSDLTRTLGPDSYAARVGAIMVGCTETTFYVITVYFGAAGVKRLRYAVAVGVVADLAGLVAAVIVGRIFFGAG